MRSSKSRSRSKSNRSRSVGNIVNRVFDSSGPEGKVRGTPQQIIDKYNQLARDAQLSNDRVAAENFQQHSEHYTRMLSEAQREIDARREQQEQQQNRERQQDNRDQQQPKSQDDNGSESQATEVKSSDADVIDLNANDGESGLVETPESNPAPKRKSSRPRKSAPKAVQATGDDTAEAPAAE